MHTPTCAATHMQFLHTNLSTDRKECQICYVWVTHHSPSWSQCFTDTLATDCSLISQCRHQKGHADRTHTWTVGLSTMEMFWIFIFVSNSFAMTWSMCTMSQEIRRWLHSGSSLSKRWNSCTFSISVVLPQASSNRGISSLVSKFSGRSRKYCFSKLATVLGSYSSKFGDSSRS